MCSAAERRGSEADGPRHIRRRASGEDATVPSGGGAGVVLAVDCPVVRVGLRRIVEQEDEFAVVWEDVDLPAAEEVIWGRTGVAVWGNLAVGSEMDSVPGVFSQVAPHVGKVVVVGPQQPPLSAEQRLRLGIAACLSLDTPPEDVVFALRAAARGQILVDQPTTGIEAPHGEQPSAREAEVLQLVAEGLSNREIAQRLCLSPRTVHWHLTNLFAKVGAKSRTHLVALARRSGWIG